MAEAAPHPLLIWQQRLWLLIGLLAPLFVNFWVEQQFEASKIWLLRTLIWLLAALWVSGRLAGLQPKTLLSPIRRLLIALVLILLLSTLLSANRTIAVMGSLDRAGGVLTQLSYLLLFVCVATQIDSPHSRLLLHGIIFTAVPIGVIGLAQAAGWQPLPVFTDARSPITTTLGRSNFTGAYLALLLPLTLTAAQLARNRWQRLGYGALAGLELLIIVLAQARAAWIAAAVGTAVLLWLHVAPHWSVRWRRLSAVGGAIGLSGTLLLVLQQGVASGGSIAARWTIWQASLRLLWPRLWLGYGADTLELNFPAVYPPQLVYYQGRGVVVDRAHNWLLDWSLNYGVVATLIFAALVALLLRLGWQRLAQNPVAGNSSVNETALGHPWLAACLAAVCAHLVGNLFLFDVAATAVLFWLLLAVVAAETAVSRHDPTQTASLTPGKLAAVVGLFLLAMAAAWLLNGRPLLADGYSWRGTQALQQGNPQRALAAYETAVAYQPHRAAYHAAAALTAAVLGDTDKAENSMRAAIALRPTDPVLYTQLAGIYGRVASSSGQYREQAFAAYEQAIVLAPTTALTYQQYADLALRLGDLPTAFAQAWQAVNLDATDGVSYGILGWIYLQNNDLEAAQDAFEQAVRWQPNSADFYLGLATVQLQKGNLAAAREAVAQSLALDPTYAPALTLQLQLQE